MKQIKHMYPNPQIYQKAIKLMARACPASCAFRHSHPPGRCFLSPFLSPSLCLQTLPLSWQGCEFPLLSPSKLFWSDLVFPWPHLYPFQWESAGFSLCSSFLSFCPFPPHCLCNSSRQVTTAQCKIHRFLLFREGSEEGLEGDPEHFSLNILFTTSILTSDLNIAFLELPPTPCFSRSH